MNELRVVGYYPLPAFVVAEKKGFFAREALAVSFEIATFAPEHNRGMAEGQWDISITSPDTMIARATRDGHDFVLYLMAEKGLQVKLVGAKEIKSPADLKGKKLAGDPGDSNYDLHRRKILRDNGVYESDYEVEIIGTSPFRLDALRHGKVSACMVAPPYDAQALSEGFNLLAKASDYIPDYVTTACWARRIWVAQNRDKMIRFVRAFVDGGDWAQKPEHRQEGLQLLEDYETISRQEAGVKLDQMIPKAAIDPADVNKVIQLRIEMGLYGPPYDPIERFYDATIWSEVTGLAPPKPFGLPQPI